MRVIEYFYGFFERRISPIPSSYPDDEIIGEGLIRYKAIEFVTDICHELCCMPYGFFKVGHV